jgi:L-aminopeptidase/D-esterase-like protein
MRAGARNLITDVAGLAVGNADDPVLRSGTTVLLGERPFVASAMVLGGAPGTRETDLLAPEASVARIDALVLSGGSAYGLDACQGVSDGLRAAGRGFAVGTARVPIVPGAILFDLLNGGDKGWDANPYPALGRSALAAAGPEFALGSAGAGFGATTADLRGGLGSASVVLPSGHVVGALVAVNALGSAVVPGSGGRFWAAPFEMGAEFGGRGPAEAHAAERFPATKGRAGEATTIAIVATDAGLDKAQCRRLAMAAHDGMARALVPAHTPFDGDIVFAAATGARPLGDPVGDMIALGHGAALVLARAIARAVYLAAPGGALPSWSDLHG